MELVCESEGWMRTASVAGVSEQEMAMVDYMYVKRQCAWLHMMLHDQLLFGCVASGVASGKQVPSPFGFLHVLDWVPFFKPQSHLNKTTCDWLFANMKQRHWQIKL